MSGQRRTGGSILRGLADPTFEHVVTPRTVGCLYVTATSMVISTATVMMLFIWGVSTWAGGGMWWFAPPVLFGALAMLLAIRITLETIMVIHKGPPAEPPAPHPAGQKPAPEHKRTDLPRRVW